MEKKQQYSVNISSPNLLNICIDQILYDEIRGRIYHCYSAEPIVFSNVVDLIREAEALFDDISFPQASTVLRTFSRKDVIRQQKTPKKIVESLDIIKQKGIIGTFIINVKYRQNSTWQGEVLWIENNEKSIFTSFLDLVKRIDYALICNTESR